MPTKPSWQNARYASRLFERPSQTPRNFGARWRDASRELPTATGLSATNRPFLLASPPGGCLSKFGDGHFAKGPAKAVEAGRLERATSSSGRRYRQETPAREGGLRAANCRLRRDSSRRTGVPGKHLPSAAEGSAASSKKPWRTWRIWGFNISGIAQLEEFLDYLEPAVSDKDANAPIVAAIFQQEHHRRSDAWENWRQKALRKKWATIGSHCSSGSVGGDSAGVPILAPAGKALLGKMQGSKQDISPAGSAGRVCCAFLGIVKGLLSIAAYFWSGEPLSSYNNAEMLKAIGQASASFGRLAEHAR